MESSLSQKNVCSEKRGVSTNVKITVDKNYETQQFAADVRKFKRLEQKMACKETRIPKTIIRAPSQSTVRFIVEFACRTM